MLHALKNYTIDGRPATQEVPLLSLPTKSDEDNLDKGVIGGLKDSQGQLQTGIVKSASINLGTRNATLTLMYDMIS